ncbi:Leukotriene A-4 hydrolase [Liparis tanakae]|uniref:Leukotriene A-4 hydrolase n=1 Tax=Liparis tanakae TaxID=230148 RepID=A0A4Z2EQR8_9TELE|nr:Leukotriene A-4 hydrolase [Liparis tanakae]
MSAMRDGQEADPQDNNRIVYRFRQPTEAMLQVAEALVGPYVWGQYDILVIAHEISHSWTGNLVTNQTWEHFW